MKKVLVYGSKEFGHVVKDLVIDCNYEFCGFIDDYNTGNSIVGGFDFVKLNYSNDLYFIAIAIGYNNLKARWSAYNNVSNSNFKTITLVHPDAYVRDMEIIGSGSIVMTRATIDTKLNINDLNVFWPGVVINHDTIIGSNNFFSPNSTVCGCCNIGNNCFIGANAVISDHNSLENDSFVKANSIYYKKRG